MALKRKSLTRNVGRKWLTHAGEGVNSGFLLGGTGRRFEELVAKITGLPGRDRDAIRAKFGRASSAGENEARDSKATQREKRKRRGRG